MQAFMYSAIIDVDPSEYWFERRLDRARRGRNLYLIIPWTIIIVISLLCISRVTEDLKRKKFNDEQTLKDANPDGHKKELVDK